MARVCKVLFIPFPITPPVAYAYFLYRRFGKLNPGISVRYRRFTDGSAEIAFGNGTIRNFTRFAQPNAAAELSHLIDRHADASERDLLIRLRTFCQSPPKEQKARLTRWLCTLSLQTNDPRDVLEEASCLFERCLKERLDPWKSELPFPELEFPAPKAIPSTPSKRFLSLPVLKSQEPGEREIIDTMPRVLIEDMARHLQGTRLGIVIGGPAGSGKSTFSASLVAELKNLIASLRTRPGWENFSLDVACANLDLATPTVYAIQNGTATNREELGRLKRPWTVRLARRAMHEFGKAQEEANLVFGDLPGGPVDTITEITAALADVAIIVTRDWDLIPKWQQFIRRMGITLVSQVHSHLPDENFHSLVTTYRPGYFISGRVVGLDRIDRSWDLFISWLAEFLLFDILPSLVLQRQEKLHKFIDGLPVRFPRR